MNAKPGASYFEAGKGACVRQHEASEGAAKWKPHAIDPIPSQRDRVWGIAHSAGFEDISAQADNGAGPTPIRLKTKPTIRVLRIVVRNPV